MRPFQKILVPTDFSPHAETALEFAVQLANTSGAAITLVHVFDVIPYTLPEGMPLYDAAQLGYLRDELGKQLDRASAFATKAGAKRVETSLLQGQTHDEIVRAAREGGFDLIVIGTHGRSGIAHLLLGSVAEKVVRKAHCPVVTVPRPH